MPPKRRQGKGKGKARRGGGGGGRGPKKFVDDGPRTRAQFNIRVDDFDIAFGKSKLLEGATLKLAYGRRYGLIGPNGAGKTTLLTHISQRLLSGIPEDISILHVEQEVEAGDESALEAVIAADTERTSLLEERDRLEIEKEGEDESADDAQERLVEVYQRLSAIGAYTAEARAAVILSGLQFDEDMQKQATKEFSGGWRMRIALARALFCRPHLLLLDEPTNHLDLFAAVWLQDFLSKWKKTLVIVSHDEEILESVCTDIIHLYCRGLDYYRGNYSTYERAFEERRAAHEKAWKKQCKEDKARKKAMGNVQAAQKKKKGGKVEKRAGGREAKSGAKRKQLKAKEKQLEKEERVREPPKEYRVSFSFPDAGKLPHPVIQVKDVDFHYPLTSVDPDTHGGREELEENKEVKEEENEEVKEEENEEAATKEKDADDVDGDADANVDADARPSSEPKSPKWIFQGLDFGFYQEDRVALVGRNGVGKSTLIKLLTGELKETTGEIYITPKLSVGRYHQHSPDQLDMSKNAITYLCDKHGAEYGHVRKLLGRYGLTGRTQENKIGTLSGGQKARVCLADLSMANPHILFLDEPTNHLDIQSIQALSTAIQEFNGGVVMVSHDKRLISTSCNKLWIVEDLGVRVHEGDFESYEGEMCAQMVFADEDEEYF